MLYGSGGKVAVVTDGTAGQGLIRAASGYQWATILAAFTVVLTTGGWANNEQTIQDARFRAMGYGYVVAPEADSYAAYTTAMVRAEDPTTDGEMSFVCSDTPTSNLTVNILAVLLSE